MKKWVYKWLPIVFGCHCIDSRSFHYKGQRFPVCARCTGELLGIVLALLTFAVWHPPLAALLVMMLPLILDGGIQMLTSYESGNIRRLLTGGLFGYALVELLLRSTAAVFQLGLELGNRLV